jgi:predicted PurR-regulated permease PerM
MPSRNSEPPWQRAIVLLTGVVICLGIIAMLYWVQIVFIPLAVATLLTFILGPIVKILQRCGLPRVPASFLVVLLAATALGGAGWFMARQVTGFVQELPNYEANITAKIAFLQKSMAGTGRLESMFDDLLNQWKGSSAEESAERPPPAEGAPPPPVVIRPATNSQWLSALPGYLNAAVISLGSFVFVLVLTTFMLLKREDLRGRILRLSGIQHLTVTTKAIDEALHRISRFLLIQLLINGTYALLTAIGLTLIGINHGAFWGIMLGVLRYVPYIGAWFGGFLLIVVSVAVSDGWLQPILVVALFISLELLTSNIAEPMLFGRTIGVSEIALLVSAAFLGFLWGPIGLVLSAPMTVCLLMLGKFVPQLKFIDFLLSDQPALPADVCYYQRLLAQDREEALSLAMSEVKGEATEQVYDSLLIPALAFTKRDRGRDELTDEDEEFVHSATRTILAEMNKQCQGDAAPGEMAAKASILGCPVHDEADALSLEMLGKLLDPCRWQMENLPADLRNSEVIALAQQKNPEVICIAALPPGGMSDARILCKLLRIAVPGARIVVGRWGLRSNLEENRDCLKQAGADKVETTLVAMRDWLTDLPLEAPPAEAAGFGPGSSSENALHGGRSDLQNEAGFKTPGSSSSLLPSSH